MSDGNGIGEQLNNSKRRGRWQNLFARFERRLSLPGDDEQTRHRKVQLTVVSMLIVPLAFVWGGMYFAFGEPAAGVIPTSYAILTLLDLLMLIRFRRYELFRQIQQVMILLLPFGLQLVLGGFVGSGIVILWSFFAVLSVLLFGSAREMIWWLVAYIFLIVAAAVLQPGLDIQNNLPLWLVRLFFVLNIVAISSIAYVVIFSFISDRRKLRALEVAYLKQDMMLRQSEKLATLGTLAAGIAHELNNPAAATRRSAEQLRDAFARLEKAHLQLAAVPLTSAARERLQSLEQVARSGASRIGNLDPLARSDRESAIESWLEENAINDSWNLAPALVSMGLDPAKLNQLASALGSPSLPAALEWIASLCPVYTLLYEIGQGSARLSEIVGALKSYTYLGQAPVQLVNLHESLNNTLVILRSKLKSGINVHRDYAGEMPLVPAHGSELNQVWTNLIDNAADALGGKGDITIRTRRVDSRAVVEIEDDGPGIPAEIQSQIFDPFFTTKAPGKGTGMGLSISHTIIKDKHRGEIKVESRPGFTRFTVTLPLELPTSNEHASPPVQVA